MQLSNMRVTTVLRRHPWAEEVLEWHGVDVDTIDDNLTLGAVCALRDLDPKRLETDLLATEAQVAGPWGPGDDWDASGPTLVADEDDEDEPWWEAYIDYDLDGRVH